MKPNALPPSFATRAMRRMVWNRRRGFTLIEIMVVVVVIGILGSIGKVLYKRAIDQTRAANHKANVNSLAINLETYASENHATFPKPPVLDQPFNAVEAGLTEYTMDGKMPSNPYYNTGFGHTNGIPSATFFYSKSSPQTWVSRPQGGVGTIETGTWPKFQESAQPTGAFPEKGTVSECPITEPIDMMGAVMYEADGQNYVLYGLGNIVPRSTPSNVYYLSTGVRTNIPEKIQNQ